MGVPYSEADKVFSFDFEHDGQQDIISLVNHGYQVEAFGKCFYYGYEFADGVDGNVRSAFIKHGSGALLLRHAMSSCRN